MVKKKYGWLVCSLNRQSKDLDLKKDGNINDGPLKKSQKSIFLNKYYKNTK